MAAAARGRRRRDRRRLAADRDLRAADRAVRPARADTSPPLQRPSRAHLFGTDELGRDVLSRVLYGARVSLPLALLLVSLLARDRRHARRVAGYFGGVVDGIVMRSDRPRLRLPGDHPGDGRRPPSLGPSLRNAVLALVIVVVAAVRARRARARALGRRRRVRPVGAAARRVRAPRARPRRAAERRRAGARAGDARPRQRDPAALRPLVPRPRRAAADRRVGRDGRRRDAEYFQCWWIGTFPGLAIFTVVLAFNFLGDSLRDVFDPRIGGQGRTRDERAARGRGPARPAADAAAGRSRSSTASTTAVEQGEVFGVAGESGSGKTMSVLALLGLLPRRRRRSTGARSSPAATCSRSPARALRGCAAARSRWSSRTR